MIGTRIGVFQGALVGTAVGSSADDEVLSGIPGVTRDGSSHVYLPATAGEWTTFRAATGTFVGNPFLLWNCNEGSGNLADAIGTFTGTLTGATPTYSASSPGWAKLGVTLANGATTQFANADAGLPDLVTDSVLVIAYVRPTASGGLRDYYNLGTTTKTRVRATNATVLNNLLHGANTQSGTLDPTNQVRPLVLRHNQTANTALLVSDLNEKLVPTFDVAVTGKTIQIGDATARCPAFTLLYFAAFSLGNAELSDAQLKAGLQALGWTIPWT